MVVRTGIEAKYPTSTKITPRMIIQTPFVVGGLRAHPVSSSYPPLIDVMHRIRDARVRRHHDRRARLMPP